MCSGLPAYSSATGACAPSRPADTSTHSTLRFTASILSSGAACEAAGRLPIGPVRYPTPPPRYECAPVPTLGLQSGYEHRHSGIRILDLRPRRRIEASREFPHSRRDAVRRGIRAVKHQSRWSAHAGAPFEGGRKVNGVLIVL